MMTAHEESTFERFTEEATQTVISYLLEVDKALKETDLNKGEITDSIDELRDHIISFCQIKTGTDAIITTDSVNAAIKKLGKPQVIADTLQSELDFNREVQVPTTVPRSEDTSDTHRDDHIHFRAKHLLGVYTFISWSLTSVLIFILFGVIEVVVLYPVLYGLAILLYFIRKTSDNLKFNTFLRTQMTLNIHLMFTPVLYAASVFLLFDEFNWITALAPVVVSIWLFIATSKDGRGYYRDVYAKLRVNINEIYNN